MMLPLMSGLAATEYIMAHYPTPILIVSSSINRGELFRTYDALAAGAVDVLEKPNGQDALENWEQRLVQRVKLVSRIKVITHPRARLCNVEYRPTAATTAPPMTPEPSYHVIALGASTGGPRAVVDILHSLPSPYPLPILLVIHIGEPFGRSFAEWLDAQTPHHVAFARNGMPIPGAVGGVLMAPPNAHLLVRSGRLLLSDAPPRHSCRPSVDVLFESVAREYGRQATACLLTGMGGDGAAGLLEVRRAGGLTLVQNEATCVVYGMPREAVALGAASRVLPLGEIAETLAGIGQRAIEAAKHETCPCR